MKAVKNIGCFLFVSIVYLLFTNNTAASPLVSLKSEQGQYHLSPFIEILEDENQEILIEQIHDGEFDDAFFQFPGDIPSFGYTSTSYWARITIENLSENLDWYMQITYPPLDSVQLYIPQLDGSFKIKETGDLLPFSSREIPHRSFVFQLDLPKNTTNTFYLHVITEGSMQLPVTLSDRVTYHSTSIFEYLILGLYYGIGLIMVIYNIFLFFSLRLKSYIWYALLVTCILFSHFTLNGLSYQYLWPNASWWNNLGILFFMVMSNTVVLFFTKSFLNTKIYTPRVDKVMNGFIIIQIFLVIILLFNYELALNLIMPTLLLLVILVAAIAVISWMNGVKPAKYFFYGWIIFLIGITISSLADMGMIPITFLTKYASQIGSGIEIALFSLALGAKIKWLRLEKEALEQKAMQSQQLAVKHLEQANRLKDEFLANTSHELRTPLQGIIGIAESLRDREELNSDWKYNLSLIVTSGERLSHLINDLLDASKLKYDELSLDIEAVQLWKVTEVVCQVSEATFEKPIILNNKVSEKLPLIAADETRLQQILYNLLSNAIKYTHKGEILITAEIIDDHVAISVQDTGIGISDEDLAGIFDSFHRGKNIVDLQISGTGLGMNITKQLVALHGGEISINSTLGKGTTVVFTVPIFQGKTSEIFQSSEHKLRSQPEQPNYTVEAIPNVQPALEKFNGKILLVDDESINVHVLYNHLIGAGYETVVACDGEQALALVEQHIYFDLIILDVMLPKLSGLQVTMKLRENYTFTELPILMLTSKSQTDDIIMAFNAGANDYLTKPCAKEVLLARVNTLLSLKQAMQEVTTINKELQTMNQTLEAQVQKRTAELEYNTIQLEQMNTARKRLMTNISHELGTPMTALKGYIKAILDGVINPGDLKYISRIYQKILFLERLIQDLYEIARLESGQLSFSWEIMEIKDFITRCVIPYEIDIKSRDIEFSFENLIEEQKEHNRIVADINRIKQVMQNLIFNAIRYTELGGSITIKAQITAETPGKLHTALTSQNYLQISICDTGKGMQPEILQHIFERFYREDKFNTGTGMHTGLGLSIAKEIIQYHDGELWAESEFGKGSCFHYLLPLNWKNNERVIDIAE